MFLTVLHRLFAGGSEWAADRWREDYAIDGAADIDLHHLYRAMAWLGEELSEDQQDGATLFAPRCLKDVIEEELFARRRNLFASILLRRDEEEMDRCASRRRAPRRSARRRAERRY